MLLPQDILPKKQSPRSLSLFTAEPLTLARSHYRQLLLVD